MSTFSATIIQVVKVIETASEFKKSKEGGAAGYYDVSSIELRIHNGDGAAWIQGKDDGENIYVLDEYHRNDRIDRCASDRGLARELRSLLSLFIRIAN